VYDETDLQMEAYEALDKLWFVQSVQDVESTVFHFALRLHLRPDLFVQAFLGKQTGALYLALIDRGQRVFGIDRDRGNWHVHPYGAADQHVPLPEGLEPKPLLKFLARVDKLLSQHNLLIVNSAK
jgi:hypothetical protein